MAFADPQSITVATVAKTLPRVSADANSSTYRSSDAAQTLTVSHTYGRRNRSTMRLMFAKTAADPLVTGTNVRYSTSVNLTIDREPTGWTTQELVDQLVALADYLKASTNAAATKFVGGEN